MQSVTIQLTLEALSVSYPRHSLLSSHRLETISTKIRRFTVSQFPIKVSFRYRQRNLHINQVDSKCGIKFFFPHLKQYSTKISYSLPPFLFNFIKAKCQARLPWKRIKYPRHETIYNDLLTDFKTQLAKYRSEQFSKY